MTKAKKLINYSKAKQIAYEVIRLKEKKIPPFNREDLFPDAIIPKGLEKGSQEHALFLFHSVSIDSMRQAEKVYSTMRGLTKDLGGSLTQLSVISKTELENLLIPHLGEGIAKPQNSMTDPVGTLLYNAQILKETCDSDPRQLKTKSIRKTIDKIDEFKQYGIPKAALLMKNYVRSGIWPFSPSEIPIKVDRHALRINMGCGVIDYGKDIEIIDKNRKLSRALKNAKEQLIRIGHYTEGDFNKGQVRMVRGGKFISALTETYLRITKREKMSAIDLDDAFWAIGAYRCKENDKLGCDLSCPIHCETRNPSDNNAVYFFIDIDKRKNQEHIFQD